MPSITIMSACIYMNAQELLCGIFTNPDNFADGFHSMELHDAQSALKCNLMGA